MGSRHDLNDELKALLGTTDKTGDDARVYFQPPESKKLKYPCYVYHRAYNKNMSADNIVYKRYPQYTLTYITYDPDDPLIDGTEDRFPMCRFVSSSSGSGLNNYYYDLFY